MMWKRKKETATPFNTERVFLAATQPLENVSTIFRPLRKVSLPKR